MKKALVISLVSFVIIVLFLLLLNEEIWIVNPDRDQYPIRGIDVSHHQGDIDWSLVSKDDVKFAYIKATEADDLTDEKFNINWENAQRNNIRVGAYHFYSLAYPGKVQAENFIRSVPTSTDQLPPAVDLEYIGNSKKRPSKEEFRQDLETYLKTISNYYNKKPILYTTYKFYNDYLSQDFTDYSIWIRDIYSEPKNKIKTWEIWQYNPRGKVKGIDGNVDLDVLNQKSLLLI
jgi:lysozyme